MELFALRAQRPRPHRDEKIIVAWNGLMISAFARAAQVLDEPRYLKAAIGAAEFIRLNLQDVENRTLLRHYKDGAAEVPGFAEDYAFLIRGLLDLYEAEFDGAYLQWALDLNTQMTASFWDDESGGFFASSPDPQVLLRFKDDYDGAEPSSNAVAAENFVRLWQFTDRDEFRAKAQATFEAFAERMRQVPSAMPFLLVARSRFEEPPLHIVIVGEQKSEDTQQLLRVIHEVFLPHKVLVSFMEGQCEILLPFAAGMKQVGQSATAYVCRGFTCCQPTNDPQELRAQLENELL